MIQAIFFDYNGVIIDDERLQMQAYQEILRKHGIELTEADYMSALGMDDRTFVRAAFKRASQQLTNETLDTIMDEKTLMHRAMIENDLPLFPGVATFLKAASRRFSLGLVTMATMDEAGYVLDRANLRELFTVIVTADDVSECKPSPECYTTGLRLLNERRRELRKLPLLPSECLVVEDSPPGISSGKVVGMRTLGITNTVSESKLRGAGADVVTASLFDWTVDAVEHVFNYSAHA